MPLAATRRWPRITPSRLAAEPVRHACLLRLSAKGLGCVSAERYDEAAVNFAKAVHGNPRFSWLAAEHAATLALSGQMEESKAVGRRLLELEPNFRIRPMIGIPLVHAAGTRAHADGWVNQSGPTGIALPCDLAYRIRAPFRSAQIARNAYRPTADPFVEPSRTTALCAIAPFAHDCSIFRFGPI